MIERMTLSAHATDRGMDSSRVAQPLLAFAPTDPTVRRYRSGLFRKDPRRVDGRLCEVSRAHNAARSASGAATIIAAPFYHRLDFGAAVLVAIRNGCIGPEEGDMSGE